MSIEGNWGPRISRRRFLTGAAAVGCGIVGAGALGRPSFARAPGTVRERPRVTHGVQSGDVTARDGVVWARADRPSCMIVEVSPTESFATSWCVPGPVATEATDYTARLDLLELSPGQEVFYRVYFQDLDDPGVFSEPVAGYFRAAPALGRDVDFVWSGDTAGQGWGINPELGGMRIYETMRGARPDFFIHSGDTIYADGPIEASVELPGGGTWRNVVTEEKSKVAETLKEFRGNHKYNLLDENVRAFNAEVPILAQWDDHDTTNNWYPGELLDDPAYTVKDADLLAARGRQAFHEFMPLRGQSAEDGRIYRVVDHGPSLDVFFLDMRTYRGPNTTNDQAVPGPDTAILGTRQVQWLQQALLGSEATWKVIASDMPIGLIVPDEETTFEAVAQGDGPVRGREFEISEVLSFIQRCAVRNVVWLTADVHYTAAHYYDPNKARFQDFDPFWEFVSGPLNSGTFGPNDLDDTFGPQVRYQKAPANPDQLPDTGLPPSPGTQFFGHVTIAGDTGVMTVRLKDSSGATLYSVDLEPGQ